LGRPKGVWLRDLHYEPIPRSLLDILERADSLTVFALDPPLPGGAPDHRDPHGSELFRDNPVIGKVVVRDRRGVRALSTATRKGLVGSGGVAGCLYPRHGVRAERGGAVVDLVICFQCDMTWVYGDDETSGRVHSDDTARDILNSVLEAAGVTPMEPAEPARK
jgi:hypothetical protein